MDRSVGQAARDENYASPLDDDAIAAVVEQLAGPAARGLLHTLVGNLVDHGHNEPKFLKVKDSAIHKRCNLEGSYAETIAALACIGFMLDGSSDAACWCFTGDLDVSTLQTLAKIRRHLTPAAVEAGGTAHEASSLPLATSASASIGAPAVPLMDLRPNILQVDSPMGALWIAACPDAFVQLVPAADFEHFAFRGSGRVRGRTYGLRADQRILLTLCNRVPGACVSAHWIDWSGEERTAPNLVSQSSGQETVQTYILHSFAIRLYPQHSVLCGMQVTERPHHLDGKVVVYVTLASDPLVKTSAGLAELAVDCQRVMARVGEDSREPPEGVGRQGPAPPPPPPSSVRGKFWGS